jgi:hypothetical protein
MKHLVIFKTKREGYVQDYAYCFSAILLSNYSASYNNNEIHKCPQWLENILK